MTTSIPRTAPRGTPKTKRVETRPLHGRAHDQYEDGAHGNESGEEQCPAQSLPPVAP